MHDTEDEFQTLGDAANTVLADARRTMSEKEKSPGGCHEGRAAGKFREETSRGDALAGKGARGCAAGKPRRAIAARVR